MPENFEQYTAPPSSEALNPSQTFSIERKSPKPKPVSEDATFISDTVFVVADGVSRSSYEPGIMDSPAAKASKQVAQTVGEMLSTLPPDEVPTRELFLQSFAQANEKVREVNQAETYMKSDGTSTTLWDNPDYINYDLAGSVVSAAVRRGETLYYGFIGDCMIMKLSPEGDILWEALTPETDRVSQARAAFSKEAPSRDDSNFTNVQSDYIQRVRRDYRNNPSAPFPTYAVLTGEETAVDDSYLITGSVDYSPGDVLILTSDGLGNYLHHAEFRQLVARGTREEIVAFIEDHPEIDTLHDDKSLIITRVA